MRVIDTLVDFIFCSKMKIDARWEKSAIIGQFELNGIGKY